MLRADEHAPTEDAAPPTPEPLPTGGAQHRRRLAYSTVVFAGATGLSRVVGLVRESVVRYYFGTVGPINAFEVAFLVPNTVRALVADAALSSAFVPVFSELLEKGERKRAWRVASSLFWLIMLGLGGLTAFFIVIAPWVMKIFGYSGVAVGLSRVLFPIVLVLGADRDRRRDPEQLRALLRARAVAGALERRDHRRPRDRRPEGGHDRRAALRLCVLDPDRDRPAVPAAASVAARPRRPAARGDRLARPGGRADVQADGPDHARSRADQLQRVRRHDLRRAPPRQVPGAQLDQRRVPPLHLPAGDVLGRRRDRPLPVALAACDPARLRRLPLDGHGRPAPDRVPADPCQCDLRGPRRADRPARLPARRLHGLPDHGRRRLPRGLLARPRLQRRDADVEPRLLLPPGGLGPHGGCARQPGAERSARRRLLPARHLGDPALDLAGEHRGDDRAPDPAPAAARPPGRHRGR